MQVTLISRKPKGGKLVRGVANEQQLMDTLAGISQIKADLVDLASMPLSDQLQLITHTDLLIGKLKHCSPVLPWSPIRECPHTACLHSTLAALERSCRLRFHKIHLYYLILDKLCQLDTILLSTLGLDWFYIAKHFGCHW